MKYTDNNNVEQKFDDGTINLKKLEALMKDAYQKVEKARGKKLVLVIGNTGAGKSTTVNYLIGCKMVEKKEKGKSVITTEDENKPCAQIGHTDESQTLYPEVFFDEDEKIAYCDCPGFQDNRETEEKLCISISRELVVKLSNNIQAVIVVIDYAEMAVLRGDAFKKLMEELGELVKQPEKLEGSILFVITKSTVVATTEENITTRISEMIKTAKNKNSRTFPLSKQDKAKIQKNEKKIKMLELMDRNKKNIIIIDALDKKDGKEESSKIKILKLLASTKILKKDLFNFNKYDETHRDFKQFLCSIADKATFIQRKIELPSNIQNYKGEMEEIIKKINLNLIQIVHLKNHEQSEQYQKIQLELAIQRYKESIKSNENTISDREIKLDSIEKEIEKIKKEIEALLNSDEETVIYKDDVKDKRTLLRVLGWTRKEFRYYGGIPFVRVEETYDKNKGSFKHLLQNEKEGKYLAIYKSNFFQDGIANIKIIAKKKDKPETRQDINNKNEELKEKEKVRIELRDKIDALKEENVKTCNMILNLQQEEMKNQEDIRRRTELFKSQIAISLKEVESLEKKINSAQDKLTEAEEILKINYESFEMVKNISTIIDFESPLISNFLEQFNKLKNKEDALSNITLNTTSAVSNLVGGFLQVLETEKEIITKKILNLVLSENNVALNKDISIDNTLSALQSKEKNHKVNNKKLFIRMLANEPEQYEVDVPSDGSCLFYSIIFSFLLPVVDNSILFQERFIKLFGKEAFDSIEENRQRLSNYDGSPEFIERHSEALKILANVNFRSRLVNFMKDNKERIIGFLPTNEIFEERMLRMGDSRLKEWGDQLEIEAMSQFLESHITVCENKDNQMILKPGADHGTNFSNRIYIIHTTADESEKQAKNHYHYLVAKKCIKNPKETMPQSKQDKEPDPQTTLIPMTPQFSVYKNPLEQGVQVDKNTQLEIGTAIPVEIYQKENSTFAKDIRKEAAVEHLQPGSAWKEKAENKKKKGSASRISANH